MLPKNFSTQELEDVYDALATAIDNAGTDKEMQLLTKLSLVLANMVGDQKQVIEAINIAERDL